jgi:hypothetical protein
MKDITTCTATRATRTHKASLEADQEQLGERVAAALAATTMLQPAIATAPATAGLLAQVDAARCPTVGPSYCSTARLNCTVSSLPLHLRVALHDCGCDSAVAAARKT